MAASQDPSKLIDKQIADLADWRGKLIARLRTVIKKAAPELQEDWKWDTAVWVHKGNVCAAGAFKDHVGLNFFHGASLPDPHKLFNGGLDAKLSRSIQFREGDAVNDVALKELIRAAVARNAAAKK